MSITVTSRITPTTSHPMRRAGDMVIERVTPKATAPIQTLTPTEPVQRTAPASLRTARADPAFVTHLLATAEQVPQTRTLRRADAGDADMAYRKAASVYAAVGVGRVDFLV